MKLNRIFIFLFTLFPLLALAQPQYDEESIERLMVHRVITCEDIVLNCSELIPKYFHQQKTDSLEMILDYWQRKCGLSEPLYRFKLLYAISNNRFNEGMVSDDIWQYLLRYREHLQLKENDEDPRLKTFRILFNLFSYDDLISDAFDGLTLRLAQENRLKLKPGSSQYLLSLYYANEFDRMVDELKQNPRYEGSKIKHYYFETLKETLKITEGHLALITGIWMPQGANKLLGNHPEIGFLMGGKKSKFIYDLNVLLRFLASKQKYQVMYKGEVKNTKHYFGGYLGLDGGYEVWRNWQHEFDLLLGIGIDGFDAVPSKSSDSNDGLSIYSVNYNFGLGYRFYLKAYSVKYVGIQAKMNLINYKNKNGTDLSGNAFTIRLELGFSGNKQKYDTLKQLHYEF